MTVSHTLREPEGCGLRRERSLAPLGGRRPIIHDRLSATDDRLAMIDRQTNRQPMIHDRLSMINDRRSTIDDRRSTCLGDCYSFLSTLERLAVDYRRPITEDLLPMSDYRRPTTDDRLSTTCTTVEYSIVNFVHNGAPYKATDNSRD